MGVWEAVLSVGLVGAWAYILRLHKRLDSWAAEYAECCAKLRGASADKMALVAQVNDYKARALNAQAQALVHQAKAAEIRDSYIKAANAAAAAPMTDPMTFLKENA